MAHRLSAHHRIVCPFPLLVTHKCTYSAYRSDLRQDAPTADLWIIQDTQCRIRRTGPGLGGAPPFRRTMLGAIWRTGTWPRAAQVVKPRLQKQSPRMRESGIGDTGPGLGGAPPFRSKHVVLYTR